MFNKNIYQKRRDILKNELKTGLVLFLGNEEQVRNFKGYNYPFRQNSTFLYYFGLNYPELDAIIDIDNNKEMLFGRSLTIDDLVWDGKKLSLDNKATLCGVSKFYEQKELKNFIDSNRKTHFLPPYRLEHFLKLKSYLEIKIDEVKKLTSHDLIKLVAKQRSIKEPGEILEIEEAINLSAKIFHDSILNTKPGVYGKDILDAMNKTLSQNNAEHSFPPIITTNPSIIHSFDYNIKFEEGNLLLMDAGLENKNYYCSDITRTAPVNKKFTQKQKDFYNIVLGAQNEAVKNLKAKINYIDVYKIASKYIFSCLKDLGITKGAVDEAVELGAHALFFVHGLGHLIGLDSHDLEDFGEDNVGYDESIKRSNLFGVKFQRFGKMLLENMVITVEPGIYFIPELIKLWKKEGLHKDFINYDKIENFMDIGGIRIEDDYLVTNTGSRKLGNDIVKTVEEIENLKA